MEIPGFIDSHMHVLGLGFTSYNVDLTQSKSITEIIVMLKKSSEKIIIIGRGFNQEELVEKRFPTKAELNLVSKDIPVIIYRVCGHVIIVNDKLMEIAGISEDTPQISGGLFSFNTGIFSEKAISLIQNKLPKPTKADLRKYFIKANQILLQNGITDVASDDFSIFSIDYELIIETILELYQENLLQINITEQVNISFDELEDFIKKGYVNKNYRKLKLGPLKILADGSLGGKTAALINHYENEKENFGILTYTDKELFNLIHLADSSGMDVVIHAIGDKASLQAITALIKSLNITKRKNHSHAIIHAQLTNGFQLELMKNYNIGAIVQPIFLNSDIAIVNSRIGKRSDHSYLFKSMYKMGINVGFSTDSPVEPVNPFFNMYCSIARKSIKNPNDLPFNQKESFQLLEALQCYTLNNLKYIYQNKLNDGNYIIVDQDISKISLNDLLSIKVLATYIDNKLVYERK